MLALPLVFPLAGSLAGSKNRHDMLLDSLTSEAIAVVAAMTVKPSPARAALIDRTIRRLKAAGIWQKCEVLHVMAAHDSQAAAINWITPGTFTGSVSTGPTFTADNGYTSNGSSSYFNPSFNPGTQNTLSSLDNGHFSFWQFLNYRDDDQTGNNTTRLGARNLSDQLTFRFNSGTSTTVSSITDATGHWTGVRRDSSNQLCFRNGAQVGSGAVASTAITSLALRLGNRNGGATEWLQNRYGMSHYGSALTDAEIAADYAIWRDYFQAVNAFVYLPAGSLFDGTSDYLSRSSALVGIADSKTVTLSVWLRRVGAGSTQRIFTINDTIGDTGIEFHVSFDSSDHIVLGGLSAAKATVLSATSTDTIGADSSLHHLLVSFDLSDSTKRYVWYDGVPLTMTWSTYSNTALDLDMANVFIGATTNGGAKVNGVMEEFLFHTAYFDPTNIALLRTGFGRPAFLGNTGALPFGTAPLVCLTQHYGNFGYNAGTGGDFTITGALDPVTYI